MKTFPILKSLSMLFCIIAAVCLMIGKQEYIILNMSFALSFTATNWLLEK